MAATAYCFELLVTYTNTHIHSPFTLQINSFQCVCAFTVCADGNFDTELKWVREREEQKYVTRTLLGQRVRELR